MFAQRGFKEATVEQIAARAGVTKGSFYSHFQSKHDIILAACDHYYRTYHRRVQSQLTPLVDPLERLRHVVEFSVYVCVIDRPNRVFTTEIFALALQDKEVRAGWTRFYDSVRELYVGLLSAAKKNGQVATDNPLAAVDLMLTAVERGSNSERPLSLTLPSQPSSRRSSKG